MARFKDGDGLAWSQQTVRQKDLQRFWAVFIESQDSDQTLTVDAVVMYRVFSSLDFLFEMPCRDANARRKSNVSTSTARQPHHHDDQFRQHREGKKCS
jgi:hypothetical protein